MTATRYQMTSDLFRMTVRGLLLAGLTRGCDIRKALADEGYEWESTEAMANHLKAQGFQVITRYKKNGKPFSFMIGI